MIPAGYFRLFVLLLWLLDGDVYCEKMQKGYVPQVQAGQALAGVHTDDGDYKRRRELPTFSFPAAAADKTLSVYRGRSSSSIYPAQEYHAAYSKSSHIQSPSPVFPEPRDSNVPKSHASSFKSGFNSALLTQRRSAVMYNRPGSRALAKEMHHANSDLLSTDAVQVPSRIYRARTKLTKGLSPVQVDKAAVGFGKSHRKGILYSHSSPSSPDIQDIKFSPKSEWREIHVNPSRPNLHPLHPHGSGLTARLKMSEDQPPHVFPGSFGHNGGNLQKVLKPINEKTDSIVNGQSNTQMSDPILSPRGYSSVVMPQPKGYAHVRHIRPQVSSAGKQNQGSHSHELTKLGFGLGVPASNEKQLDLNYNSMRSQTSLWHPPPPNRALTPVRGKFKPFQRLPTNDDSETAPTLPPNLNSTGITSTAAPSVSEELSTRPASPMQTELTSIYNFSSVATTRKKRKR